MTTQSRPDWPIAKARILYGSVNDLPNTGKWLATLTYSFFYEGYRAGEYTREFSNEADAADFVRNAKDRQVLVRYHPRNADRSILEKAAADQLAADCIEKTAFEN